MKIDVNVLPDGQKEKMKEEKKVGFALKLSFSFIAVLLLVNAVFFLMQMILKIEYQSAKKSSAGSSRENSGKENQLEDIFQKTNTQVKTLSKIKSEIPNWARVVARIPELCPYGIRISRLSAEENRLKISGFSKSRDEFLIFQDDLKKEGFQFPVDISNLVASHDFNFDLELEVPQDYLIRK